MPAPSCILIAGPTASGKSGLALRLACRTGGWIVNADALQVYGCWRILTARPSEADAARVPHRLYGHVSCNERYSAGAWLRDVARIVESAASAGATPIIVGGTGLYFRALTQGLAEIPPVPEAISRESARRLETIGTEAFRRELVLRDPASAALDIENPRRALRAWDVFAATGRSLADWASGTPPPLLPPERIGAKIVLNPDREALNARIEARFDAMIARGAVDEVARNSALLQAASLPAAKALGAPLIHDYLAGNRTLESAVDAAKTETRRYAKRQRTWFRNQMSDWPQFEDPDAAAAVIEAPTSA